MSRAPRIGTPEREALDKRIFESYSISPCSRRTLATRFNASFGTVDKALRKYGVNRAVDIRRQKI